MRGRLRLRSAAVPSGVAGRWTRAGVLRAAALGALAMAAGCAGRPVERLDPEALTPCPSGLAVAGTDLEIGFGRAQEGAEAAVARLIGPPSGRAPCDGQGEIVRWPTGIALHFPGGTLSGWEAQGRSAGRLCDVS